MEAQDPKKCERLDDDILRDVNGGDIDFVSHYYCPKLGKQLSSYNPYFAKECSTCGYRKQIRYGVTAECRY